MSLRAPDLILRKYAEENGPIPIHRGEGNAGDCGNLKPRNTKTVYFFRRPPSAALRVNSATWQSLALRRIYV